MIRKILSVVGVLVGIFVSANVGLAASGLLTTDSSTDMITKLFDRANIRVFDADKEEIDNLSMERKPFENLYLFMYQNVKLYPRTAAIQVLAGKTVYSEEEIEDIVVYGDFTPILLYYREIGLAEEQDLVAREFYLLQTMYDDEFAFQIDNYSLSYETEAQEIFMNGDTTDSANIDLLFDLDIINYLLFGEFLTPVDRSGEEVTTASIDDVMLASEGDEAPSGPKVDSPDPLICQEDGDLRDALDAYEDYLATLPPAEGGTGGGTSGGSGGTTAGGSERTSTGPDTTSDRVIEERQNLDDFVRQISGTPGDWSRKGPPCNEVFCVKVNLVSEPVTAGGTAKEVEYEEEENCIACHVAYIAARMEETLGTGFVPGKVSMNVMEDGTCKEAGKKVDLDLNVYLVKKPIILDPGDDIEEQPANNVEELMDTLVAIGTIDFKGKSRDETDFENLAYFHGEQSLEDMYEDAEIRRETRKAEVKSAYDEFVEKSRGDSSLVFFEQMAAELFSLSTYLSGFQEALQATYLADDAPITGLVNTEYCR
ncbi:hypothetical protein KKC94_02135 [Patescibacteria group bacterium]|nr:hypothetical protein [Patescibacteria group bacterium]